MIAADEFRITREGGLETLLPMLHHISVPEARCVPSSYQESSSGVTREHGGCGSVGAPRRTLKSGKRDEVLPGRART